MNRIRDLRKERGLTQGELGQILNVSDRSVGFYETGERDPDTDTLMKLADFFDVTIDYLLGRSEIKNPYDKDDSVEKKSDFETKSYHNLDKSGLPEEAIRQIDEYIEFIKQKYDSNGDLKKKGTKR